LKPVSNAALLAFTKSNSALATASLYAPISNNLSLDSLLIFSASTALTFANVLYLYSSN
jgi:hypothetical protein